MNVTRFMQPVRNTGALLGRASRNSVRVILPINDCALIGESDAPAFYCVHSASGVAGTDFLALAAHLEPSVRFFGIQAPPKLMSEPGFGSSVESLAERYADAVVMFQPTGPIFLGGYCVGAVIALAMAKNLEARGRTLGPLVAIDGVPENTGVAPKRWGFQYWVDLARNIPGWVSHADLMRSRTVRSLMWSLSNNANALGKRFIGLNRGEKFGGGYSIDGIMDLSQYSDDHRLFIDRLFSSLFAYAPVKYTGSVVVYEAHVKPLLYLPQVGRTWKKFAPHSEIVEIVGTHISMLREPYVHALANDLRRRLSDYSVRKPAL